MEQSHAMSALAHVLSSDQRFEGIGPKRAATLCKTFGSRLHHVLSSIALNKDHDNQLLVYQILPEKVADTLFHVYPDMIAELDFARWLDKVGVEAKIGAKIVKLLGAAGASSIQANPFLLVGWVEWKLVTSVARSMGLTPDDRRWQVGAVEAALYQGLEEKHTIMRGERLRNAIIRLIGNNNSPIRAAQAAVDEAGASVWGSGLQPVGAAIMEAYCADKVKALSEQTERSQLIAREVTQPPVDEFLRKFDLGSEWPLTKRQREAIFMTMTNRLSLLGGYAGSGKTTVLRAIADLAEIYGRELHLLALSGRAAKRMSELTGRPASTIAKFLQNFDEGTNGLTPESLVIIDEASMVDLSAFYRILRKLGQGSLLLVGDPAQLPPIGFGLVFHELVKVDNVPRTMLDRVLRQTEASGIPMVAKAIRNGHMPDFKSFDGRTSGVSFIPCSVEGAIQCVLDVGKEITSARGETQIISPIKAGDAGIEAINRRFSDWRGKDRKSFPGKLAIKAGDPIIWTKNDYERGLQNGSMGRYLGCTEDAQAIVELDGQKFELTLYDADNLDLAYGISVHKAQGSQWRRVIIPLFQSRILDRALIYTAITRATEQVVLIGDLDSIKKASLHSESELRQTTLGERLRAS